MSCSEYIKWLKSDKQLAAALTFLCLYLYLLTPLREAAQEIGEPVNIFEPFITFCTNIFCMPLITVCFTAMMIDFPDISANATFVLIRAGRKRWYCAQIRFVILSAATFLAALLIFSMAVISSDAFFGDVWSNVAKIINGPNYFVFRGENPLSYPDMTAITNFAPIKAVILSTILALLHLTLSAQLQMAFTLKFNKLVGTAVSIAVLGAGMALQYAETPAKWLLPLAHSTVAGHYDSLFNEMYFPIWSSALYLVAANIAMYFIGVRVIKRKNLSLMSKED